MKTGIYKITSPSGNFYIGSAVKFAKRWCAHKRDLACGKHHSNALQSACYKYGVGALKFEKLLVCNKKDLLMFEQRAIDILNPKYNMYRTAGSALGHSPSIETRLKLSAANKGRVPPQSTVDACRLAVTGRKASPETLAKMSAVRIGKKHTRETIEKIIVSGTGLKRSKEQCDRIRVANTGRKATPAARENMRNAQIGLKKSPDACKNMSIAQRNIQAKKRAARLNALIDFEEQR